MSIQLNILFIEIIEMPNSCPSPVPDHRDGVDRPDLRYDLNYGDTGYLSYYT